MLKLPSSVSFSSNLCSGGLLFSITAACPSPLPSTVPGSSSVVSLPLLPPPLYTRTLLKLPLEIVPLPLEKPPPQWILVYSPLVVLVVWRSCERPVWSCICSKIVEEQLPIITLDSRSICHLLSLHRSPGYLAMHSSSYIFPLITYSWVGCKILSKYRCWGIGQQYYNKVIYQN